jgi:hypothetical protein
MSEIAVSMGSIGWIQGREQARGGWDVGGLIISARAVQGHINLSDA